jgi:hypothetical protein
MTLPYGLAAYVHAGTIEQAGAVGARIRAGQGVAIMPMQEYIFNATKS